MPVSDTPGDFREDGSSPGRRSPTFAPELVLEGLMYGRLHFQDPRGATTSSGDDSAFRQADLRRRVQTQSSEVNVASAHERRPTSEEQAAIETLATMQGLAKRPGGSDDSILKMADALSEDERRYVICFPLIHLLSLVSDAAPIPAAVPLSDARLIPGRKVRDTQRQVARLNEGPLTPATPRERRDWTRRTFGFWGHFLEYRHQEAITQWRDDVDVCIHRAQVQ